MIAEQTLALLRFAVVLALILITYVAVMNRLDSISRRLDCIAQPAGASSIAGVRVHGRFVVTQPATRTGCP